MVFSTKTTGKTTLKADSGFSYNAFLNKVLINGDVQIGKNIDSIATNISIFSSSANITIGQNASDLILAPESLKIIMGANYTETAFSGSVSGSLLRFNIVSGSNGNFTRASGSLVNITDLTNLRGKFSYITSSVTSGSKAIFTKLSSSLATGSIASYGKITGSNVLIEQDLKVGDDVEVTGSFKFRTALTGSGPTGHKLFVSGAGALQGYMGIMINGTKYKIPLYAW